MEKSMSEKIYREMKLRQCDAANYHFDGNNVVITYLKDGKPKGTLKGLAAIKNLEWIDNENIR